MHDWNVSPKQARVIQQELRGQVIQQDQLGSVKYIAGVDLGYDLKTKMTRAAVAILTFPQLQLYEYTIEHCTTEFPYVPGLLSFREVPAALVALEKIKQKPDLILCDGQGIAHPRRFGLACHLGLLTDIPTIGVAKSRLIGEHQNLPMDKGAYVALMHKDEQIGVVLRSRQGVRPLYISVGHKISLPTAIDYVMASLSRYRLPETTRWADRLASKTPNMEIL